MCREKGDVLATPEAEKTIAPKDFVELIAKHFDSTVVKKSTPPCQ